MSLCIVSFLSNKIEILIFSQHLTVIIFTASSRASILTSLFCLLCMILLIHLFLFIQLCFHFASICISLSPFIEPLQFKVPVVSCKSPLQYCRTYPGCITACMHLYAINYGMSFNFMTTMYLHHPCNALLTSFTYRIIEKLDS